MMLSYLVTFIISDEGRANDTLIRLFWIVRPFSCWTAFIASSSLLYLTNPYPRESLVSLFLHNLT